MKKYFYENNTLNYTKEELFNIGLEMVKDFCEINNISPPTKIELSKKKNNYRGMYFYNTKSIILYANSLKNPTKLPGFCWSFPGYKADITAIGVICHELGHHVENILRLNSNIINKFEDNNKISSYEPNAEEAFAETFRLFLTNPSFLKILSPYRYKILTEDLKLKPIITVNWDEVLCYANEKHIKAVKNKIK